MRMIEQGTCSGCGKPAQRGEQGGWWHARSEDVCRVPLGGVRPHFVEDPAAAASADRFRFCRACDVKWWGQSTCWSCGDQIEGTHRPHVGTGDTYRERAEMPLLAPDNGGAT